MYKSLLCILDTYSADLVQLFAYYASVGKADIMAPDSMTLQQARAAHAHSGHTRTHSGHTHTRTHARTHTPGSIEGPAGPAGGRSNAKARDESPRCIVRLRLRPQCAASFAACVRRAAASCVARCAMQVRRAVRCTNASGPRFGAGAPAAARCKAHAAGARRRIRRRQSGAAADVARGATALLFNTAVFCFKIAVFCLKAAVFCVSGRRDLPARRARDGRADARGGASARHVHRRADRSGSTRSPRVKGTHRC